MILSDAEGLMPENIKKEAKFVELFVGIKKENVEGVFGQINEDNVQKACKIITFSADIRPLEVESLSTLVSLILSKFNVGSIGQTIQAYCDSFTKFVSGGIKRAIREDNIEQFCEFISDPSFDAKEFVHFDSGKTYNYKEERCESYMQLIAYFGAVKCFKQAIMNDAFDLDGISNFAVAGGSNEIVRILEQKGISFDNCFEVGVRFHRMDLCDWLLMHTKCESISLSSSLKYFNYHAFIFTFNKKKSFKDALFAASENGHIEVVKYLIEQ
jgi:hypothetical protein